MVHAGGGGDHVTSQVSSYSTRRAGNDGKDGEQKLRHGPDLELPLELWDTWGLDPGNWKDPEVLKTLLKGGLPEGWSMDDVLTESNKKKVKKRMKKRQEVRQMHSVLFFVPAGALDDEEDVANLKEKMKIMKGQKLNPIVLLAWADFIDPELRKDAMTAA